MSTIIREMLAKDLESALQIWADSEGIGLSSSDAVAELEKFLKRNPGLSHVAVRDGQVVGAVLCGHDGRRGYLHHLAVVESHRRQGVGSQLVDCCLNSLRSIGIMKCHLFIFEDNTGGVAFWRRIGWTHRSELAMMSILT